MKRICLLKWNLNEVDGGVKVAIELANELSSFHSVFLVDIASDQTDRYKLPFLLNDNVIFHILINKSARVRNVLFLAILKLRKYIKDNNIDIIISVGTMPNAFWFFARVGLGVKVIYADHMSLDYDQEGKLYYLSRFIGARYSDKIVTLTESNKNKYINKFNLPDSKIDFIYNWFTPIAFRDCEYHLSSKSLITVGRFSKQKGFDLLAEVAGKLLNKYPDLSWDIYGEGDENIRNQLLHEVSRFGISDRVFLKGNIRGTENIYPNHSIYVMTSYYEGLPLVLLEAQQYKLPIVSFNCPTGPSEIIRDGVNGFLVDNYDVDGMVEKISELIENEALRKSFSNNTLLDIEKFSKEKIIQQWLDLIEKL